MKRLFVLIGSNESLPADTFGCGDIKGTVGSIKVAKRCWDISYSRTSVKLTYDAPINCRAHEHIAVRADGAICGWIVEVTHFDRADHL
jgi:hypothetical protein